MPKAIQQDYSQEQILVKLQQYLDFKKSKMTNKRDRDNCVLPFASAEGLCAGLSAFWLYSKRIGEEYEFNLALSHILNWDPKNMDSLHDDAVIEDFMNAVAFLSFDTLLRTDTDVHGGIKQHHLEHSFKYLLPDEKRFPQFAAPEYKVTFVFDLDNLTQILKEAAHNNKMLRLNNMQHTIALMKEGNSYVLYDAESKTGAIAYKNASEAAAAILAAFAKFNGHKKHATVALSIYDLAGAKPATYLPAASYYEEWLSNQQYKKLCSKDTDVASLGFLHDDTALLSALIQKNAIDLNKPLDASRTPLQYAIVQQNSQILFELLSAGADPNLNRGDTSLWDLAYYRNDANAMVMLLAFGYDVTTEELGLLRNYSQEKVKAIFDNAISLNQKILQTPPILNLNIDNDADAIVNYLQHAKLKYQLGRTKNLFNLEVDNIHYKGPKALEVLRQYYKIIDDSGIHEFSAKAEFYKLLKFFKNQQIGFKGSRELISILDQIGKKIPKDPKKFDAEELLEVSMMLNELTDICNNTRSTSLVKIRLVNKAASIQKKIHKLLESSSIAVLPKAPRNYLFFAPTAESPQQRVSYERDIVPLLRLNQ